MKIQNSRNNIRHSSLARADFCLNKSDCIVSIINVGKQKKYSKMENSQFLKKLIALTRELNERKSSAKLYALFDLNQCILIAKK